MIDRDRNPQEFARVLSLSDSIFGVAMTLLVVSIVIPAGLSSSEFSTAVVELAPRIAIMALSIAVAASAWLAHQQLFGAVQRIDSRLLGGNFVFLGLIALIPLPHQVLGAYPHEPLAYVLYALVLGAVNAMGVAMEVTARRRDLLRERRADDDARLEVIRGSILVAGFAVSIPLAFVLVSWTPLIWVALLPLDRLLVWRRRRARPDRAET
ncbi:TMEM175 family protein [Agromyces sp. NPDC058484]|uniref:TMEM175 family protein n=1 Tax=Agromyces sp. NPDC058484 TaxID=3346524 RepID=UPI003652CBF1